MHTKATVHPLTLLPACNPHLCAELSSSRPHTRTHPLPKQTHSAQHAAGAAPGRHDGADAIHSPAGADPGCCAVQAAADVCRDGSG